MDVMIEPAEFVDETQYFKQLNFSSTSESLPIVVPAVPAATSPSTPPQKKILQAEVHQVEQSPEAVIIKVVLPGTVHPPKGCYCCSYCDFSSSVQQEILNHINENHRPDIQYTCSICNKVFLGNKEGIATHFAQEHPNQPILYKSMPDFYDVGKLHARAAATVTTGPDKGNIFDRMSDLFSPQDQTMKHGKRAILDRTSAEADSTTAEGDLMQGMDGSTLIPSMTEAEDKMDGIEELGKSYSEAIDTQTKERTVDSGSEKDAQDDIGLKIVDVVSLSDQVASVWNDATGQNGDGNSRTDSPFSPPSTTKTMASSAPSPADAISALRGHLQPVSSSVSHGELPKQTASSSQPKGKSDLKICTTYKCEKCNVHAPVLASMVEHLRISHKDIEKLFLCPYCRQYEGATEPDIHRHIKQFHQQNMQQKSPPVALSSAAKQHLRTIQVPAGDANKVGDKYVIEKDIYKCLKCNGHMPSLDFIYTHIEKQHNEFFVNVCPYCKVFKSKDEEVVLNHIRQVHGRSTEDITLSVAIEENLFTRVQCLVKSKPAPPKPTTQSVVASESFTSTHQNVARMPHPVATVTSNILPRPQYQQHPVFIRPNIPMRQQSQIPQMTFPSNVIPQSSVPFSIPAPLSKSSLRKSRPQHRDKVMTLPPGMDPNSIEMRRFQLSPRNESAGIPPPLLRAPPPLIRFQNSHLLAPSHVVQARPSSAESFPLSSSYSRPERMQTVHSSGRTLSPQVSTHSEGGEVTGSGRPVLKVPSVRSPMLSSSPPSRPPPPPYDVAKLQKTGETTRGSPLDLSRALAKQTELISGQSIGEGEQDDMPPDAFQIFNIRPGSQPSPEEAAMYNQFQVRPNRPDPQRQRYPMSPHQICSPRHGAPQGMMYPGYDNPLRPFTPRSNTLRSPPIRPGSADSTVSTIDRRVFKCPYCTQVVPLNMGEVAPHIEKYHPGHSIVFSKLD
ncbi:hypothetical protein FSP39_000507 [Pinctada imbricata]|uniref:C2H2-type domain-containing protein n=1 Tax=Pinctada imbricata TaxID=66713 RepID=A0AA88XE96_PINIB|nr:hypothetical protein FSP39_000507 [Pinctada imbricata]